MTPLQKCYALILVSRDSDFYDAQTNMKGNDRIIPSLNNTNGLDCETSSAKCSQGHLLGSKKKSFLKRFHLALTRRFFSKL